MPMITKREFVLDSTANRRFSLFCKKNSKSISKEGKLQVAMLFEDLKYYIIQFVVRVAQNGFQNVANKNWKTEVFEKKKKLRGSRVAIVASPRRRSEPY